MDSPTNWFAEAQKLHQAQHFAEAERLYRRVVEAEPSHLGSWHHLGLVCIAQNRLPEASEAFEQVIQRNPDHHDALTQLGIVLARMSRLPDAIAKFRRALEIRPDYARRKEISALSLSGWRARYTKPTIAVPRSSVS